jgi:alginate O-acetyltransferase complex protein AlgJ
MNRFDLEHPVPRLLLSAALLSVCLLSVWNLAVKPDRQIRIGPKLGGVTREAPVVLSWSSFADGSFQKAVAGRVAEAFFLRPLLIRINNEVRFELFGAQTAPTVVSGSKGHLFERSYLDEYCARREGQGATAAEKLIPKLKTIQDYYQKRGAIFVYVVSPSKVAYMPESVVGRVTCPSTPAARAEFVPQYVAALEKAGINVLDGASLIHGQKGRYDVDLFPEGGAHWNDLGGAIAVSALVREINAQAGRELVPPFTYTYSLSRPGSGADRELVDLLNVFFPPLGYLTPKVNYNQPMSCDRSGAPALDAAIVGSSFAHMLAGILIEHNCLRKLNLYYYARVGRFGDVPYRELQRDLGDADLAPLRDARIMIVESNESFVTSTVYIDILLAVIGRQ